MDDSKQLGASRAWSRLTIAALVAAVAGALVAACGGGGSADTSGSTTSSPTAATFSAGRIAGFGSIIVNGVHFDETNATVTDDDGNSRSRGELALGMVVEVHGGAVGTDATSGLTQAAAATVNVVSELRGAVQAVDTTAQTLTIVGQTVKVDSATVYDGFANGLASITVGQAVEVYALFDSATKTFTATRIEAKPALAQFKLRGTISNLDKTAKTFNINTAKVSYAGIPDSALPANLADGLQVRVNVLPNQQAGTWVAVRIRAALPTIPERSETEVEGLVADFASLSNFKVGGVTVDASGANVTFRDGTSAQVANGVRIEVEGTMQNGVLVARQVELKQSGRDGHASEVALFGLIDSVGTGSFVVRGVTVTFDANTRIDNGTAASLVVGARVAVQGTLSTTGTGVVATRISMLR